MRAKRNGKTRKWQKLTDTVIDRRVRWYQQGISLAGIAEREGVSHQAISESLRRAGVEMRPAIGTPPKEVKQRVCQQCECIFELRRSSEYHSTKFCSQTCAHAYRASHRKKLTCYGCGEQFPAGPRVRIRYCSDACKAQYGFRRG